MPEGRPDTGNGGAAAAPPAEPPVEAEEAETPVASAVVAEDHAAIAPATAMQFDWTGLYVRLMESMRTLIDIEY